MMVEMAPRRKERRSVPVSETMRRRLESKRRGGIARGIKDVFIVLSFFGAGVVFVVGRCVLFVCGNVYVLVGVMVGWYRVVGIVDIDRSNRRVKIMLCIIYNVVR